MKSIFFMTLFLALSLSCERIKEPKKTSEKSSALPQLEANRYNVAFLIMEGTYNTEFTAPYDIFQHTQYRKNVKAMNTFTVANTLEPITTFEGVLDTDLKDTIMLDFVKKVDEKALFMTSHCDGAFVLAKAGLLNEVASTTFPSDIEAYKKMFPQLDVKDSVLFVHDGKYITSAGGAKSFEAALYLCEYLYGREITQSLAKGLVIDWNLEEVPRFIPQ